eukprot:3732774-Rhodomonas_salina.1
MLNTYQGNILTITAGVLGEGRYQIVATVTDFFGTVSGPGVFDLEIRSTPTPSILFSPAGESLVSLDEDIIIKAQMGFSKCPIAKAQVEFAWTQVGGSGNDLDTYLSTTAGQAYAATSSMYIPAKTLTAGKIYEVQVTTILNGDATKTGTATHVIKMKTLSVQAVIGGGAFLSGNSMSALTLDARLSRDLNLPKTSAQGLSFAWTCVIEGTQPCLGPSNNLWSDQVVDTTQSVLTVPAASLAPTAAHPYKFTVTVSKGRRTSSFTMNVFMAPPTTTAVPDSAIDITTGSAEFSRDLPQILRDGTVRVNSLDELTMTGSCSTGTLQWSFMSGVVAVDFNSVSSTNLPFGTTSDNFKIASGTGLLASGQTYTATVTCTSGAQTSSSSLTLRVNNPPTPGKDGPCTVCAKGTSKSGCEKFGAPTGSVNIKPTSFEMKCEKWGDTEDDNDGGGLMYRFGMIYATTGLDLGWTEWQKSKKFKDGKGKSLAAGGWTFKAQVRDSKGAVSDIMYDDVEVDDKYDVKVKGGKKNDRRRRLLATSLSSAWDSLLVADDGLEEGLQLGDGSLVLDEVKALVVNMENDSPVLTSDQRTEVTRRLYAAIDDVVQVTPLTSNFITSALEATQYITTTKSEIQYVSANTAVLASKIMKELAGSMIISTMADTVAQDAYNIAAVALSALQYNISCIGNETGTTSESAFAKSVMANYETGLDYVASKYAASLITGEGVQEVSSFASMHQVYVNPLSSELGVVREIAVGTIINTTAPPVVDFVLPSDLATVLGIAGTTDVSFDFGVYEYGPVVDKLVPVSPVVSGSLFNGLTYLNTSELTSPVVLTIPLDRSMLCAADAARFTGYGRCMHWDNSNQMYTSAGCTTTQFIGVDQVTCRCNHLTSFVVVPDF